MPYTVWMQCGCMLDAIQDADAALCTAHPVARPIRRQHETGHVETISSGSWEALTGPVTFLSSMTQAVQTRAGEWQPSQIDGTPQGPSQPTPVTRTEIREFTREWLRLQAAMRPSPVALGRFQTLEVDTDNDD